MNNMNKDLCESTEYSSAVNDYSPRYATTQVALNINPPALQTKNHPPL